MQCANFFGRKVFLTKEEIKNNLQEDSSWTLSDNATDADWDLYLEVKKEMTGANSEERDLEEIGGTQDINDNDGEF